MYVFKVEKFDYYFMVKKITSKIDHKNDSCTINYILNMIKNTEKKKNHIF